MFSKSAAPSFMQSKTKRQESAASQAGAGAKRLGAFGSAMTDKKKPANDDPIKRIQAYAHSQNEKKKKPAVPSVAPSKGFFGKMVDKYYHGKKDE
jgi:hypothetical protein